MNSEMREHKGPPRATVIIPAYNASSSIEECLASVLQQTERNIEVIVVDDGSTDDTMAKLEAIAQHDSRVVALSQQNGGGGAARNRALAEAQGDYLFFLDADDLFRPTMVEAMCAALDDAHADVAICAAETYNLNTGIVENAEWIFRTDFIPPSQPFSWKDMPGRIFNSFGNVPWNKAFRRSFIEENGLRFQELRRTNDCLFVCSALIKADAITTSSEVLATYRVGGANNCQATNDTSSLDFFEAFKALKALLEDFGAYSDIQQSFVNHALDAVMYNLHSLKTFDGFSTVYEQLGNIENTFGFLQHNDDYYYDQEQWHDYVALREQPQSEWLFNLGRHRHNDIMSLKDDRDLLQQEQQRARQFEQQRAQQALEFKRSHPFVHFASRVARKLWR